MSGRPSWKWPRVSGAAVLKRCRRCCVSVSLSLVCVVYKTETSLVAERSTPEHATREQRFKFAYTWSCKPPVQHADRQRLCERECCAYNPPTAKMEIKATFCLRPRFRLCMTGIGSMMIAKSVTMFIAALVLGEILAIVIWIWSKINIQPHRELVNAFRTGFSGPECPYWNAGEDAAKNCPESVDDNDSHETPTR